MTYQLPSEGKLGKIYFALFIISILFIAYGAVNAINPVLFTGVAIVLTTGTIACNFSKFIDDIGMNWVPGKVLLTIIFLMVPLAGALAFASIIIPEYSTSQNLVTAIIFIAIMRLNGIARQKGLKVI